MNKYDDMDKILKQKPGMFDTWLDAIGFFAIILMIYFIIAEVFLF